jgi:acetyl-CoA acyltransferase 1
MTASLDPSPCNRGIPSPRDIPSIKSPRDVVIISAVRTPLCRANKGDLAHVLPSSLLATVLRACLQRKTIDSNSISLENFLEPAHVQDICVGSVLCPASGAASMRMAQLSAGYPSSVPLHLVNRQCSSGLQAVAIIADAISNGTISVGIGAGVESMSTHPMNKIPKPDVDWELMKSCPEAMDCIIPMGITSENVCKLYKLDRTTLDKFAARSHYKANLAKTLGKFQDEIIPVGKVKDDDGIRPNTSVESLSSLKPVFDPENGLTTAGNSSQLTDGAAAVLLMSRMEAERRRLPILGVFKGYAVRGVPPKIMGIGPAVAIPAILQRLCMTIHDIDLFEINEAFASQAYWCIKELGIDENKVNVNGGAIALGHPLGCTGARLIATILHEMKRTGKRRGVVSMCIGTGMGAAAVLETEGHWSHL